MEKWQQRLYQEYVSSGQASFKGHLADLNVPYFDKLIETHLPKDPKLNILDLACGHGKLIHALKKHGFSQVSGIDISQEQVDSAHQLGLKEIQCQDLHSFLKEATSASFDVIFMMDILEHLDKQEVFDVLDEVARILKPNGTIILHVPNGAGLFGMKIRYGDFTHINAFTHQSMQQVLLACGFKNVECFEDKPTIHGLKSLIRYALWQTLTLPLRLLLAAESGTLHHHLSQNILVKAKKS